MFSKSHLRTKLGSLSLSLFLLLFLGNLSGQELPDSTNEHIEDSIAEHIETIEPNTENVETLTHSENVERNKWYFAVIFFLVGTIGAYILNSKPSSGAYGCAIILAFFFLFPVYLIVVGLKNEAPYLPYLYWNLIPLIIGYILGVPVGKMARNSGV